MARARLGAGDVERAGRRDVDRPAAARDLAARGEIVDLHIAAIAGEATSDAQMRAFKADPRNKGKVCDTGLWSLSRHPNYFFEWLAWLAYIPIGVSLAYPWGWLAVAGPLLMYWLLVHASGIPPLEAHMLRSRGKAFRDYQQRVNAFWPGPQHWANTRNNGGIR